MFSRFSFRDYHPSRALRILNGVLLVLIVIGIILLLTQKLWVPKLVNYILKDELTLTDTQVITERQHPYDGTYMVNGAEVTLVNGIHTAETTPDSASRIVTKYFGNEARGDIDGDSTEDVAFLITQETGGSGTFFYATAQLNTTEGVRYADATFIGDRIAPQSTQIENGLVLVNYAERAPEESFATPPSFGKTLRLKLDPTTLQFGEVVANFEGEADPERMSLTMHTWKWQSALYEDGRTVAPVQKDAFTLTFSADGTFSASTDCNGIGGTYTATDSLLAMSEFMGTLMYCEGSQESVYTSLLQDVSTYHFTSKGELILGLKYDSGSMIFR
jgi:heat shock protein HslJ